jgi:TRAP-type C4-dicarboxylate transport system permease small subunit
MKTLEALAKIFSILGGLLMTGITLMTCYSLIGRNFLGTALMGDFELTAIGCGLAIAFFMPYCQLRREHIIVDFFTARLTPATNRQLDRMGALLMALLYLGLGWRASVGGLSAWKGQGASMLLGFPDWIVYSGMSIAFVLAGLIALVQLMHQPLQQEALS